MLSRKSNLPAVQTSTALAVVSESAAAIVAPGQVPKTVTNGIKGIMLAFPAQGIPDADRPILQTLYLEAVAGFPRAVVEWTLKFLVFNNPRNTATFTTAPTPQDVREACQKTWSDWSRWVREFYFRAPYGAHWGLPTGTELWNAEKPSHKSVIARSPITGPKPGEVGCIVPDDLQIVILQEEIERQLKSIERHAAKEKRGEEPADSSTAELLVMPEEAFDRVPHEAFPDDSRETIRTIRKERVERARQRKEHDAYVKSLPEIVRRVRCIVQMSAISDGWSEDQIMSETKLRIGKIQREKADCQASRAIYVGTSFDDGSEFVELPADRRRAAFAAPEMTDEEFERRKAEMIEQLRKEGFEI